MNRIRRHTHLNTLLFFTIISIGILILISSLLMFYQTYQQVLLQNARTNSQRTISQVSNTVNGYLEEIDTVMEILLASLKEDPDARESFFDVFFRIRPDVIAVSTYAPSGQMLECYSAGRIPRKDQSENLSLDLAVLSVSPEGYLSSPHVVNLFDSYYPWAVTLVRRLSEDPAAGWISLDISCSNLSDYINETGIGRRGYCFLMDRNGNMVYHPQQQLIYSSLKTENTALISGNEDGSYTADNIIYTVQTLANEQWRVVGVSFAADVISDSLVELGRLLLLAALLLLCMVFIISAILSRVLSRPIRNLEQAMQRFEQDTDHFLLVPYEKGIYEIRNLYDSFQHMTQRVKELMQTVREEENNLRRTELKALQAQINPHFLYNTLDSISWMCEQGKNEEAVQMVTALARLFRISISRGHELIPIRNELEHARSYLQIQSVRYQDQFTYTFDVDEECLDYLCNKITLQPLIENSLYHGLNGLVDDGEIRICVRSEGDQILMSVADNGSGMSEEQIRFVMSKDPGESKGIGLRNVSDRLRIFFGNQYTVTIRSIPDKGTTVTVHLPKILEETDYEATN
ncbi:MAG: sensor histidine kinase [Parasporobacterium sp.]|nr:sensor histidine kinase [Parasporobacterium sp.]